MGVEEKGVISEGTGMCSTFSIATWVKKTPLSVMLLKEHDNFIFFITFITPMSEKIMLNPLLYQQE